MTLLESIVAFIVLALVGIACLDLSRGAVELQRSSEEWTQAVAVGESALASAAAEANVVDAFAAPPQRGAPNTSTPNAFTPRVSRHMWRDGVDVIDVTVPLPSGGEYQISRLIGRRGGSSRVASDGAVARSTPAGSMAAGRIAVGAAR